MNRYLIILLSLKVVLLIKIVLFLLIINWPLNEILMIDIKVRNGL